MENIWVQLAVNAALTLVLGVLAILITPITTRKIIELFERRRTSSSLKQKNQELADYARIKAFHEGKKDRYFFYVFIGTLSIGFAVMAATAFIATMIYGLEEGHTLEGMFVGFCIGIICLLISVLMLVGLQTTATKLEKFDEYEKRVKEQWPEA